MPAARPPVRFRRLPGLEVVGRPVPVAATPLRAPRAYALLELPAGRGAGERAS